MTIDTMIKDYSHLPSFMEERRAWLQARHGLPPVLHGAPDEPVHVEADPWVVVGTTTIDGSRAHVASAFGCKPHGLGPTLAQAMGFAHPVGGRLLRAVNYELDDNESIVRCDIVRRQSEIDAERKAHIDFVSKWAADPWRIRPIVMRQMCPECGPHGNAGRVCLASTWVACTVCAGGKPGDAFGAVEIESVPSAQHPTPTVIESREFLGGLEMPAVGDKVRTKDGILCSVERIHKNEPRFLLSGIGWRSTDEIKAVGR